MLCSCFRGRIRVGGPHWTALIKHLHETNTQHLSHFMSEKPDSPSTESLLSDLVQTGSIHLISADIDEALWLVVGQMGSS